MATIKNVALLGLGIMGSGMAGQLLQKGFALSVYNRTRSKAEPFAVRGARVAASPREAAQNAELIFSMVGDDTASRAMWSGPDGALANAVPGTILVETSTLSPAWTRELAALAAERNLPFLDAPVMGSKGAAAGGTLRLLIGGEADVIEAAKPALLAISEGWIHMGPNGAGTTTKLINNMMIAMQLLGLAEGMALAEHAGLSQAKFNEYLQATGTPFVKNKAARMMAHQYGDTDFSLGWMRKDIAYVLRLSEEHGAALPGAGVLRELLQLAVNAGYGEKDIAALVEFFRAGGDR